jgi:hypothetical protein
MALTDFAFKLTVLDSGQSFEHFIVFCASCSGALAVDENPADRSNHVFPHISDLGATAISDQAVKQYHEILAH